MEQTELWAKRVQSFLAFTDPQREKVPRKGENFNMSSRKLNIVYHFYLQILIYVLLEIIHS